MCAKKNLGTAFLHLPLSLIRNAVLGSLFNVNGVEVGFNGKSYITDNIFHHILQFIKCFSPMGLGAPKSLPIDSPGVTETEGQIKVSRTARIKMRADLRTQYTIRSFWSSPQVLSVCSFKKGLLLLSQLADPGSSFVTRVNKNAKGRFGTLDGSCQNPVP